MKKLVLLFVALLCSAALMAQTGGITGKVTDAETGEELIGCNVVLKGTTTGSNTDLDGRYLISNLAAGTYDIQVSYVSYETKVITGVEVTDGENTVLDITLGESAQALAEVVVETKAERSGTVALVTMQRKAPVVMDGISAQQFQVMGDNDAAAAAKRVTGVSIEGGKYVVVRGLGDRYSKIMLNGAEIPSLDPSRNSVQMDLFPSNMIDNLMVSKTFSPENPGDFTGGLVMISTKDFPENYTFSWSSSLGYNTNATFNSNYLSYQGSSTDWLGFDNGARAIPQEVQDNDIPAFGDAIGNPSLQQRLDGQTKSFNSLMSPVASNNFFNQNHSLSVGNQVTLGGRPFGFIVGATYQNSHSFYENGQTGRYVLAGGTTLDPQIELTDSRGEHEVLWGALANFSYKLNSNNKIALNLMRNQGGKSTARYQIGLFQANFSDDGSELFESRTLAYRERNMNFGQLKGEHFLENAGRLKLEWHTTYSLSGQDEPDLRFFANDLSITGSDTTFSISPSNYNQPARYHRTMTQNNWDTKVHFILPFDMAAGEAKLKFGGSFLTKTRTFEERRLDYAGGTNGHQYSGEGDSYFDDNKVGIIGENMFGPIFGPVMQDATELRNSYDADQQVFAAYVGAEIPVTAKLKANGGVRMENTVINVISRDTDIDPGLVEALDFLPALNLIYGINDNNNVRASYSRTLARPTFRELAPYASFDFVGDFVLVGNPNLTRSLIDNLDLRYEFYPSNVEKIMVSAFYKRFTDPIERAISPEALNTEIVFRNVSQATAMGLEFEVEKRLDFVSPALENFMLGANLSLINSRVTPAENEINNADRQMYGQSPYLVNAFLNYNDYEKGTVANVNFNMFGPRLFAVSGGFTPNVFEQPRPTLNASFSQKFGEDQKWKVTARGSNLLNPEYNFLNDFEQNTGVEQPFQKYKLGASFSLGISLKIE